MHGRRLQPRECWTILQRWWVRHPTVQLLMPLLLAAVVSAPGMGHNDLWDDEANTAIIGRNFMASGSFTAWDGYNLMAYGMTGGFDDRMRKTAPPLQYVIAGVGMRLFGESTAGVRLLFWLIGLAAIPLTALWYRAETGLDNMWVVALVLALSVPFLLYARQVRYYPLGMALAYGVLWIWAEIGSARRWWLWAVAGALAMGLLILSQYLYAAGVMAVMAAGGLRPRYRSWRYGLIAEGLLVIALTGLLWVKHAQPYILSKVLHLLHHPRRHLAGTLALVRLLPRELLRFEFLAPGALAFMAWPLTRAWRTAAPAAAALAWLLAYGAVMATAISLFNPQSTGMPRHVDMRYYTPLIPLGAALAGAVHHALRRSGPRWLAPVFLAVLLSSNLLTFGYLFNDGPHSRLGQYLRENLTDHTTGSEAIGRYIAGHVAPDECLLLVPHHTNLIQMFYHPSRKFCGLVTRRARFAKHNYDALRPDLFFENALPSVLIVTGRERERFQRLLDRIYGKGVYALAEALPVDGANRTRPEIPYRRFGPPGEGEVPPRRPVLIFRLTPGADGTPRELTPALQRRLMIAAPLAARHFF